MKLAEIDTPALIIELDSFERNLGRLADAAAKGGVGLRPHAKTHKSAIIAHKQIALGALGACCQKVSEAEALVHAGVPDILVSNEVIGRGKLMRLAALARLARIGVCVDDPAAVAMIEEAAGALDTTLTVLVEIDVGANRCGVEAGAPALRLAEQVARAPHLRFDGLQAYQGAAQHLRSYAERRAAIARAAELAETSKRMIERAGIPCPRVSGAGTGTYRFEIESGVYTELQCGSYVFMDADYARNRGEDDRMQPEFEQSLFVLATVMSRPTEDRAILDAGLKAVSVDSGMPLVVDHPGVEFIRAADEHGRLQLARPTNTLRLGDKVRLVPGHCDPTVNLYDWYVCLRQGKIEALWPIDGRGAIQ
jgi:D-serine deaminase-like pyridoxal phosphate-dependent protein